MKCPVCKTKRCSHVELEEDLRAASCESCGGHWISNHNYAKWLKRQGETLPEKPFSEIEFDVGDVSEALLCPGCSMILLKYRVGHGLDFFLDHCPGCGGVWLDRNEWKALQSRNLHDEIHSIFSTPWQNQVRGDHMAEKLDEAYQKRFGPEIYIKLKEIRQWLHKHPQKQAIIGFLATHDPYKI